MKSSGLTFSRTLSFPSGIIALCILLSGCGSRGSPETHVHGTVTYDGKPLNRGVVMFVATETAVSSPARSSIRPDGSYKVSTAPGEYRVTVTLFTEVDPEIEEGDPRYKAPEPMIPIRYTSPSQTPLKCIVEDQGSVVNLELTSK